MCTTRCSVRIVKHEPIGSQRIHFEILFSVMKSPWTVEFEQTIHAFVIQLYKMNLRNTKSQLSLGINTLALLGSAARVMATELQLLSNHPLYFVSCHCVNISS